MDFKDAVALCLVTETQETGGRGSGGGSLFVPVDGVFVVGLHPVPVGLHDADGVGAPGVPCCRGCLEQRERALVVLFTACIGMWVRN